MTLTDFTLRELNPSNLASIHIFDKSAGRFQGRRFELVETCQDGTQRHSGDLIFKDLLHRVGKLAKIAISDGDLDSLEKISTFLEGLKNIEVQAAKDYEARDCLYKLRTWFHRLFSFGSHQDKFAHISKKISKFVSKNINQVLDADLDRAFNLAKKITDVEKKDDYLAQIGGKHYCHFWENVPIFKPLEKWVDMVKTPSSGERNSSLLRIIVAYLKFYNDSKASELIELMTDEELKEIALAVQDDFVTGIVQFIKNCDLLVQANELLKDYRVCDESILDQAFDLTKQIRGVRERDECLEPIALGYQRLELYDKALEATKLMQEENLRNIALCALVDAYPVKADEIQELITGPEIIESTDQETSKALKEQIHQLLELGSEDTLAQAFEIANKFSTEWERDLQIRKIGYCYHDLFWKSVTEVDNFEPLEKCVEVALETSPDLKDDMLQEIIHTYSLFEKHFKVDELINKYISG